MNKIDEVKEFWNNRPCNIKHSNEPIGSLQYSIDVETKKYLVEPHILDFVNFYKCKNKKVLEIGCGIGTDSINFVYCGANLTCIDISEKSLEICKNRFDSEKLKQPKIICGNAEELDILLPNEKFDLVYSFGVIHHTPNPQKIIDCINKLSHKDTEIKLMLYSKYSWKSIENFIKYGYKFGFDFNKTVKYYAEAQTGCPIAYTYSKKELLNMFKKYDIVDIHKTHIFPYIIKYYIKGIYKKRLIFRLMPKKTFSWLENKLGWHWLITLKIK